MAHSVNMFFGSFLQLFKKRHLRTTMLLFAAWTFSVLVFHGLTIYIAEHTKTTENDTYNSETVSGNKIFFKLFTIT